jgi:hypothetical protein
MDIERLANELHDKGVFNLDTPVRTLLEPEGLSVSGSEVAGFNIIAWDRYALITDLQASSGVSDIAAIANTVRRETRPQ